uniref:CHHC U11-48K-type domain-containing protein n=1 Tax=Graphocephala atropunctata TaxID=36148 RepID=A0A1B6MFQ8_9HEMI
MPVAGDEGYEKLVICPYDKSHEVRLGRMQFHLDKCRKNFPSSEMVRCPFNSVHLIAKVEQEFHTQEECSSRSNWDRSHFEVGDVKCPVKDLVPVNAATVPDGDENWDDHEAQGSVLGTIKDHASNKNIYRLMQCESKAKRKNFRKQEKERHEMMLNGGVVVEPEDNAASVLFAHTASSLNQEPLRRPTKPSVIKVERQDPAAAMAALSKQFRTLDMEMKPSDNMTPSETSSLYNGPPSATPSIADVASVSRGPISYAAASSRQQSRPSTSMSVSSRPSTAMSIAASVNRTKFPSLSADGFCQVPIPGLGRGRGVARQNQ